MSDQASQSRYPLSARDERKQLLTLVCAADRAAWVRAFRPLPPATPAAQLAGDLLGQLETLGAFLPGRLGRWLRRATVFANLGRQLGWLRL